MEEAVTAVEWQPEHDAAPGGGSDAASSGWHDAAMAAAAIATHTLFIGNPPEKRRPQGEAAVRFRQAKVMFWSRRGTERMRLPVAAK